jgi:HEAT repeat protein
MKNQLLTATILVLLSNTRKTVAVSSAPRQGLASCFPVSRRASAPFALACEFANAALPSETAQNTIAKALDSRNPDTRKEAVKALAIVGSGPYRDRLESMLCDRDMQVRLAAVENLAELKDAPALHVALDDRAPEVRFRAAKALFSMNDPWGQPALLRVLSGDAKTESNFFSREKRDALHTLQTPKPMMMLAVRCSSSFAPVPGAGLGVSTALRIRSNRGASNRTEIALLLGRKSDPEIIAALRQALADKHAAVRAAAIEAIALGNDPARLPETEAMLDDKNSMVRLCAAACYLRLRSIASGTVVRGWDE